MDRVRQLYLSFSASERKALRTYLEAFHLKGENKALEFLKLIEKSPDISQEQAADKLYGESRSKAFIMMKGRLLDKLTEFLTLSVNPDSGRRDPEAPYHQDLIEFRKAMLSATALQERQLTHLALEYLERARDYAARCNMPELEVDALIRIRGLDRTSNERFEALSIQIQKALVQQELDINAMGLLRKFVSMNSREIHNDEVRGAFLAAHLPELEERLRQTYSPRADYFYQMLQVHHCFITRSYERGKLAAQQAAAVLKKYEGMRNPLRLCDTWFQLARLELRCGFPEKAIEPLLTTRAHLPAAGRAHVYPLILLTYCYLYAHDIAAAEKTMAELVSGKLGQAVQANALAMGFSHYLQSCLAYYKGDVHQAWLHLQGAQDPNLGRESWLTPIRIFEVMLLIDKDQRDIASQKLENLRKHLARYQCEPRSKVIYKLLAAQERTDFSFHAVNGEEEEIRRLREELAWDPVGQEIVRFEDWYLERRQRSGKR